MQVAILSLALFVLVAFQTVVLIQTRGNLVATRNSQDQGTQQGQRVRQQLDVLATGTARLAAGGDQNAAKIVEDFRRQGVTFTFPNGTTAPQR